MSSGLVLPPTSQPNYQGHNHPNANFVSFVLILMKFDVKVKNIVEVVGVVLPPTSPPNQPSRNFPKH